MVIAADTVLTQDHDGTIEIAADGVTLDCNGHNVRPTPTADSSGILVHAVSGVTIEHCNVAHFDTNIRLESAPGAVVRNNNIIDAVRTGVRANECDGLQVMNNEASAPTSGGTMALFAALSDDAVFQGNRVEDYEFGISSFGSNNVTIMFNTAEGGAQDGISISNVDGATIHGNTATGYDFAGMTAVESSNVNITGNILDANAGSGFKSLRVTDMTMTGNIATNNAYHGFDQFRSTGFHLSGNLASGNAGVGMLFRQSTDGTVQFNNATNNAQFDAQQTGGATTTFFGNIFLTTDGI